LQSCALSELHPDFGIFALRCFEAQLYGGMMPTCKASKSANTEAN